MNESRLKDAALAYAAKGYPTFPLHGIIDGNCTCGRPACDRKGKHPRTANGLNDATTDPAIIEGWWELWPDSNIGLRTGIAFDVLDVDGKEGRDSLQELPAFLPTPLIVETGSKGLHYFFKPTGAGNKVRFKPGLDWRGTGGYIVAPPSQGLMQKYGVVNSGPITEAPDWLKQLVVKLSAFVPGVEYKMIFDLTKEPGYQTYGKRALDAELSALASAEKGKRNDQLNRSAFALFQLVKAGILDYTEVYSRLGSVAEEIGLGGIEIEKTLASAWDSAEARQVKERSEWLYGGKSDTNPGNAGANSKGQTQGQAVSEKPRIEAVPASSIKPKRVRWLWTDRVPTGSLTLLGGREGIGKSMFAYDLVSDITLGKVPGEFVGQPKSVLVAATEDSWEHTIVPRLLAAKADLDRVFRIEVEQGYGEIQLPRDIEGLASVVKEKDASLILLDPLLSRLATSLDTHKDSEVRQALEPITKLADVTGAAVVGLIHVNKSGTTDPLSSLMGSRAFVAVARAVLYIMTDPDDERFRLLAQAKNNLGRMDVPMLQFSIENVLVSEDDGGIFSGKLEWNRDYQGQPSYEALPSAIEMSQGSKAEKSRVDEVSEWLLSFLKSKGGSATRAEIMAAGTVKDIGFTDQQIDRARKKAKIETKLIGMPAKSYWYDPRMTSPDLPSFINDKPGLINQALSIPSGDFDSDKASKPSKASFINGEGQGLSDKPGSEDLI